jgi:hypothetical protein
MTVSLMYDTVQCHVGDVYRACCVPVGEDLSRALSSIPTADAIDLPADPAGRIAASKSLPLWLAQQWVAQVRL